MILQTLAAINPPMTCEKKYRWARTWGDETGLNGEPHEDYTGHDGPETIGQIYRDIETKKKGLWRWAGGFPKGCKQMAMPNEGWKPTSAEAARTVEEYWDRMKTQREP